MRKGVKTPDMALYFELTTKCPKPFENLVAALGGMILVYICRSFILYQKCNFWQIVQYCFRVRVGLGNKGKLSSWLGFFVKPGLETKYSYTSRRSWTMKDHQDQEHFNDI